MPLPSSSIGYYDFSNQYRAGAELAQGSRQIANQMVNLGASISASLTENNQRKEAQALAPQLAATYQQGFSDIFNGNPSGGLSTIYGASMSASQNPFLAKMAQQATTAANWATNNYMKQQMDVARINSQFKMGESRNAEFDRRFELQNKEYDRRLKERQQTTGENKPLTPLQKFNANNNFNQSVSKVFEDLNAAETEEEFNLVKTRLKQMVAGAREIGLAADTEGIFAQASPEERAKIKSAGQKVADLEKKINDAGWFTNTKDLKSDLASAQADFNALKKETDTVLQREREEFEKQIGSTQGEDTIPLNEGQVTVVNSQEQYEALPSGAKYRDGAGNIRQKK